MQTIPCSKWSTSDATIFIQVIWHCPKKGKLYGWGQELCQMQWGFGVAPLDLSAQLQLQPSSSAASKTNNNQIVTVPSADDMVLMILDGRVHQWYRPSGRFFSPVQMPGATADAAATEVV